jgi:hypothetical protein
MKNQDILVILDERITEIARAIVLPADSLEEQKAG